MLNEVNFCDWPHWVASRVVFLCLAVMAVSRCMKSGRPGSGPQHCLVYPQTLGPARDGQPQLATLALRVLVVRALPFSHRGCSHPDTRPLGQSPAHRVDVDAGTENASPLYSSSSISSSNNPRSWQSWSACRCPWALCCYRQRPRDRRATARLA